jgi:hypothetical protein
MQNQLYRVLILAGSLGVAACSDPETPRAPEEPGGTSGTSAGAGSAASGGTGGSGGSAGTGGSGGSAPLCNELELDAPAFEPSYDPDPAPAPEGGDIVDGTYFITGQIFYEMPSGPVIALGRTRIEIEGTEWQEVSGDADGDGVNPDRHWTQTLSTSGTTLGLERTCPTAKATEFLEYTVEGETLIVYVEDANKTVGTIFTKQ